MPAIESKEEKLAIKNTITFVALKAFGQLVRFHMLSDYRRPGANYSIQQGVDNVCFEGIFLASSIGTGEFILQMVQELLITAESEQVVGVWTEEPIHLRFENVAWVQFVVADGMLNLTRDGFVVLPK